MIDLHFHSIFSDGSLTPEQLAEAGQAAGLTAMALTDHDSTQGVVRFQAACAARGIRAIPGVEISADVAHGTLHMLGYFMDTANVRLQEVLEQIRDGRQIRNRRILARLNEIGCRLEWDEVARHAGSDVVGRPHFALALMEKRYAKDKDEAFGKYLGKGKAAYVDRFRLSAAESIDVIRQSGGIAVLAHPFTLQLGEEALREQVRELRAAGLAGIEAYYSEHSPEQHRCYMQLAQALDLGVSGGTDFHGAINPDIRLGTGFGQLRIPDHLVDELAARCPR